MKLPLYESLEEKSNHFESVNIENKGQLDELIEIWTAKDDERRNVFRGVSDAKYKLYNSAQRVWQAEELWKLGKTYNGFIQAEIDNIKAYQGGILPKFYKAFGHSIDDLSILSFLQHYKAPTPLLDFTYDFNKALFFATDGLRKSAGGLDIDNYFSVYSFDINASLDAEHEEILPSVIDKIRSRLENYKGLIRGHKYMLTIYTGAGEAYRIEQEEALADLYNINYKKFAEFGVFYIPGYSENGIEISDVEIAGFKLVFNQYNLNVISQDGLFVYNPSESYPLEYSFKEKHVHMHRGMAGVPQGLNIPKMKCWNIHKALSDYIVKRLAADSITSETMYPQEEVIANQAFAKFKQDI